MSKEFGNRVIALLREKGRSQKWLAAELETSEVTLSRYLSGEREPGADTVVKTAEIFGTSCDYLLTGKTFDAEVLGKEAAKGVKKNSVGTTVAVSFAVIAGLILLALGMGVLTDKDKENLSDMLKNDKNDDAGK